ncbi:MAG: LiaF transmembrane domain-containing protein, partial [Terriglobales bacterium]
LFAPLLLILLGVIFLLIQFGYLPPDRAWAFFWPFIFIFFGVRMLGGRQPWLGVVGIAVGVALAGTPLGYWNLDVGRLWPVLLILCGLSLLARPGWPSRQRGRRRDLAWAAGGAAGAPNLDPGADSEVDGAGVLGGFQSRVTSQQFRGGRLTAFFGGFQLDLTRANIAGESAMVDVSALFGGGEIRVPETWIVDIQGQGLFGAFTDETHQQPPLAGAKHLIIRGSAIFGGVVVKN